MQKFQILGEIKVQHEYFERKNPMSALRLQPETLSTDPNLKFKPNNDGLLIYSMVPLESLSSRQIYIPFYILDPNYLVYTALDLDEETASQVLYFDSIKAKNNVLSVESAERLNLYPLRFTYPTEGEEFKKLNNVTLGPIGGEGDILPIPGSGDKGCLIDLTEKGIGCYQITFTFDDQSTKTDRFFASDKLQQLRQSIFALLSWQANTGAETPLVYTISFSARSTYWRYFIFGLSAEEGEKTELSGLKVNDQEIAFIREKKVVEFPNEKKAYVFHSEKPIPFHQRPPWRISLTSPKVPDKIQLPFAKPGLLKPVTEPLVAATGYVSEIYVYL